MTPSENIVVRNYTEYLDMPNGYQLEIRGEVFENSLFKGDVRPIYARVIIVERLEGNVMGLAGVKFYDNQLTDTELSGEVKAIKEKPLDSMYEDFSKKYE
jgi:hypothetical protein